MGKGLASFAAGFGSGYLNAQQRGRDQERQDKLDAQGAELHTARMDEVNQAKSLRMGLADAAAPREVQAGAVLDGGQTQEFYKDPAQVTPQMQDDRRIEAEMRAEVPGAKPISLATGQVTPGYGTTGKMSLGNMITKDKPDAAALNSPEAKAERIGLAYGANGRPVEAIQFQKNFEDLEQSRKERFAKLQSEGSTRTARAMLSGSPEEVFRTFNAQGKTKLKEAPAVRSEDIDMPGIGKVKNHIYSGVLIDENGQEKPFTMGSHDANMALLGYKDMLEVQAKGLSAVEDGKHKAGMLGAAQVAAEASRTRAEKSGSPSAPGGYRFTGSGSLEPIPGGPATVQKPLNDNQSKALLFGSRMQEADKILAQLASEGTTTSVPGSRTAGFGPAITAMSPEKYQMLDQAKRDFMSAVLRRESGAAIAESEYANADKQYFPQINDEPGVIAQKAKNRQLALTAILAEVPEAQRNSLSRPAPAATPNAPKPTVIKNAADYANIPSGATYIAPDGQKRTKQ